MGPSTGALVWPWWGRSLPKGNQWEWWDPQQGPLSGLGEVGHSPRGTIGSAGTLDWGPICLGLQSTCHLQCTPYTPMVPNALDTPYTPMLPWCHLYPCWPKYLHSLPAPMHLWHPYTLWQPPISPDTPRSPWCQLYPCWPWVLTLPTSPNTTLRPPTPPDGPNLSNSPMPPDTPTASRSPMMPPIPLLALSTYPPCQPQCIPDTYTLWQPQSPLTAPNAWTPLGSPNAPDATHTPADPWVPRLPASPNAPWHLLHPLTGPQHL